MTNWMRALLLAGIRKTFELTTFYIALCKELHCKPKLLKWNILGLCSRILRYKKQAKPKFS